ncbi:MAG: amidohydrolase [Lentisphaerae bacterium]|nr:amidohydrolase [Lentisphaerota bacterium]
MSIIDMHTHVPPASRWLEFRREMQRHNITLSLCSSLGLDDWPQFPDSVQLRQANAQAAEFCVHSGGMLLWLAYINPLNADWRAELELCLAQGCRGIKLWISLRRENFASLSAVHAVLEAALELNLPVLIHTFHRSDALLPGEISLAEFAQLASEFPALQMIGAHAGCNWHQAIGLLDGLPNAYVDISGGMPEAGMLEALLADLGAERIMFGSDALGRSFGSQLAKVFFARCTQEERALVLKLNAQRVFNISETELSRARQSAAKLPALPKLPLPEQQEDHFIFAEDLPFKRAALEGLAALSEALQSAGLKRAYCVNGNSVYSLDTMQETRFFAAAAASLPDTTPLFPLATLLPGAYNWRAQLHQAQQDFGGGWVSPYLHAWRLDDERQAEFFAACAEAGFPLWINLRLHDWRFRPAGSAPRAVSQAELLGFLAQAPPGAYVFQGANKTEVEAILSTQREDLRCECSRLLDGTGLLDEMLGRFDPDRLLLGSEYPLRELGCNAYCLKKQTGF